MTYSDDDTVVREALAEGRGILYLTPHLGCFEITARNLLQHGPITVMYRPPRQAFLEPIMEQARNTSGLQAVPAALQGLRRSEERRVGKEGVSTCSSRGAPYH